MFEGMVADQLNKYLGDYIDNIDLKQLSIGIWAGDVVLENLAVKASAFDALDLPVTVVSGFIGKLVLKADWKNLGSKPVVVEIDRVYILVGPKRAEPYDATAEEEKAWTSKQSRLAALEAEKAAKASGGDPQDDDSFTGRLVATIVNNLQIRVSRIHIRYENDVPGKDRCFAAGITLERLSAESTDKHWKPCFIEEKQGLVHKLVNLRNLAVYWDTHAEQLRDLAASDLATTMDALISVDGHQVDHHYIVRPVCGGAKVIVNNAARPDMQQPKLVAHPFIDELAFRLEEDQYHDAMELADSFSYYNRGYKYRKHRPAVALKDDPKAWWTYAMQATREDVADEKAKWSPAYFSQRRRDKKTYISLYKVKKNAEGRSRAVPQSAKEDLEALERRMSFDDIKYFRSLADIELKEEAARAPKPQASSWFSGWWGGSTEDAKGDAFTMTDEQRQFLYSQIDYTETTDTRTSEDAAYIRTSLDFQLKSCSFTLVSSREDTAADIVQFELAGIDVSFVQRPSSMKAEVNLRSLFVRDLFTERTAFPLVVQPKATIDESLSLEESSSKFTEGLRNTFLQVMFEQHPLDGHADTRITVATLPLEVVYSPDVVARAGQFFSTQSSAARDLSRAYAAQVNSIKNATQANVSWAREHRTLMDLQLDIQAPHIIIPEDVTDVSSPELVLDLGRLLVTSDLSNIKKGEESGTGDTAGLYDTLDVRLHAMQAIMSTGKEKWRLAAAHHATPSHLIEKFDINIKVRNCIVTNMMDIPQTVLSGTLPALRVHVSTNKVRTIMKIIKAATHSELPGGDAASDAQASSNVVGDADFAEHMEGSTKQRVFDDTRLLVGRVMVDAKFVVKEITIIITDDVEAPPGGSGTDLARLSIRHLGANYIQHPFDMDVKLALSSLFFEDLSQTYGDEYRYIASSVAFEDAADADAGGVIEQDLVSVRYLAADKNSPAFVDFYMSTEATVDLAFAALHVQINPNSIQTLLQWSQDAFPPRSAAPSVIPDPPPEHDDGMRAEEKARRRKKEEEKWRRLQRKLHPKDRPVASSGPSASLSTEDSDDDFFSADEEMVFVAMKVTARLQTMTLTLNRPGRPLARVGLRNVDVKYSQMATTMQARGSLGGIFVDDLTAQGHTYKSVIGMETDKKQMVDFSFETFDSNAMWDMYLRLRVNTVRIVFLQRLINDLMAYNSVTIARMLQPLSSPAQPDGLSVVSLERSAEDTRETTAVAAKVMLDIAVASPVIIMPRHSSSSEALIAALGDLNVKNGFREAADGTQLDVMDVDLIALNLRLRDTEGRERTLIDNTNMDMKIVRSLTPPARTSMPDIAIDGKASSIQLRMSQADYAFLLGFSGENLGEEVEGWEVGDAPSGGPVSADPPTSSEDAPAPASATSERKISMSASFSFPELSLCLLADEGEIASLIIHDLVLGYQQFSDSSIYAQVDLFAIVVRDERQDSPSQFREILNRSEGKNKQLTVKYAADLTGSSTVEVVLDHPVGVIVFDSVNAIQAFFALPDKPGDDVAEDSAQEPPTTVSAIGGEDAGMKVTVKIANPEFILVEDWRNAETRAFVLQFSVDLLYSAPRQGGMVVQAGIMDLQVVKCFLFRREETEQRLIEPFSLRNASYTVSPFVDEDGLPATATEIKASLSPVDLRLSYQDYLLIMIVLQAVSSGGGKNDTASLEEEEHTVAEQEEVIAPAAPKSRNTETVTVSTGPLRLILINDQHVGQNTPLLDISLYGVDVQAKNWSSTIEADISLSLRAEYFNTKMSAWEPMLEPWTLKCVVGSTEDGQATSVFLESRDTFDLNVSHTMVETIYRTQYALAAARADVVGEWSPYKIRNDCGHRMRFWLSPTHVHVLAPGEEMPFSFHGIPHPDLTPDAARFVVVQLAGGWDPLTHVPVDRVGSSVYTLAPMSKGEHRVVCSVALVDNCKLVTIHSTIRLLNRTCVPIEFKLDCPGTRPQAVHAIFPGEETSVPVTLASTAEIRVRKAVEEHANPLNWSAGRLQWKELERGGTSSRVLVCSPKESLGGADDGAGALDAFVIGAQTHLSPYPNDLFPYPRHVFTFFTPLVLENSLPVAMSYEIIVPQLDRTFRGRVNKGEEVPLNDIDPRMDVGIKVKVDGFSCDSTASLFSHGLASNIRAGAGEDDCIVLSSGRNVDLRLNILRTREEHGTLRVSVYAPYWLVNRTGVPLVFAQAAGKVASKHKIAAGGEDVRTAEPVMFSYSSFDLFKSKAAIKTVDSEWSQTFSLESIGSVGVLSVKGAGGLDEASPLYDFSVKVELGDGPSRMVKVVTFSPRFVFVSRVSTHVLQCRQSAARGGDPLTLPPGTRHPFHWPDAEAAKMLSISFAEPGWSASYSRAFSITDEGIFAVKLSNTETQEVYILPAEVKLVGAITYVLFAESNGVPPFRIRNDSTATLVYWQKDMEQKMQSLVGGRSVDYAWDDLEKEKLLVVRFGDAGRKETYDINDVDKHQQYVLPTGDTLDVEVVADGPTRSLLFTPGFRDKGKGSEDEPAEEARQNMSLEVKAQLHGIGISIVDSLPQELMYISLSGLDVCYTVSDVAVATEFKLHDIQINNQLPLARHPVVFGRLNVKDERTFLHASVIQDPNLTSVDYYQYFSVLLQEANLKIEENLLMLLLDFVTSMPEDDAELAEEEGQEDAEDVAGGASVAINSSVGSVRIHSEAEASITRRTYFKTFWLHPIQINVTFASSAEMEGSSNPMLGVLRALGVTLANIDDARIRLNSLLLENLFGTHDALTQMIVSHYTRQALRESYKIIGSFDILGNPVGLFTNLSTGVLDFFYEPAMGLVESPQAFGAGLGKGTASLAKNTVFGLSNTASKLTGTASKGLGMLAMDEDYVREHEARQRERPKHVGDGFALGVKDLTKGVFDGVTGIVYQPFKGAREEGALGFVKGAGRGVVGAVVKPVAGVMDLAAKTTEGIRNTATYFDAKASRSRHPRFLGPDRILKPYCEEAAIGQDLLFSLQDGKYSKTDYYVCHARVPSQSGAVFLVSSQHCFVAKLDTMSVVWGCPHQGVTSLDCRGSSIHLNFHGSLMFGLDRTEHVVELDDEFVAAWAFDLLQRCHKLVMEGPL